MTTDSKKFAYHPMRKPTLIQPDCPVYVYAYALAVQKEGDAAFVQVRLVNRSDKVVHSVFLRLEGRDSSGKSLYDLQYVPLVECMGKPHSTFGEEQPLFLPAGDVSGLSIQVLDVLFEDGMIWRKQAGHALMTAEQAGWEPCVCGMKNPGEAMSCAFCGKSLKPEEPAVVQTLQEHEPAPETVETPAEMQPEESPVPILAETDTEPGEESVTRESTAEALPEEPQPMPSCEAEDQAVEEAPTEECSEASSEELPDDSFQESADETPTAVTDAQGAPEETSEEPAEELLSESEPTEGTEVPEEEEPTTPSTEESESTDPIADLISDPATEDDSMSSATEEERAVPNADELFAEDEPADSDGAEESPMQWMQETERMLEEFRRRMQARENGEMPAVTEPEQTEAETPEEPAVTASKGAARGVMFWVLMVILLVILGAAAFFGVLYFKGYFG